jgi:hypothetical protein
VASFCKPGVFGPGSAFGLLLHMVNGARLLPEVAMHLHLEPDGLEWSGACIERRHIKSDRNVALCWLWWYCHEFKGLCGCGGIASRHGGLL